MRAIGAGILATAVCSAPLLAQESDRSLDRISIALHKPSPVVFGAAPIESDAPKELGIFSLAPPAMRGEMVRVSIPLGELVTRAFDGIAAANQRRQEAAARRKVDAALKGFAEQPPRKK